MTPQNLQPLSALGNEIYRQAQIRRLETIPLANADRIGQYACLIHERLPKESACLYLLDAKKQFLRKEILFSGRRMDLRQCCERIASLYGGGHAAYAALSVSAADSASRTDLVDRMSRIELFCDSRKIYMIEVVFVYADGYAPLYRLLHKD